MAVRVEDTEAGLPIVVVPLTLGLPLALLQAGDLTGGAEDVNVVALAEADGTTRGEFLWAGPLRCEAILTGLIERDTVLEADTEVALE